VKHLHELSACVRDLDMSGFGLGEQLGSILRTSRGLRTKVTFECMANVVTILACDIGKSEYLGPSGTKSLGQKVLLASFICVKLEGFAQAGHGVWHQERSIRCGKLRGAKSLLAIGARVAFVSRINDRSHIGDNGIDQFVFLFPSQSFLGSGK
jgi:hypothetical protein